MIGMRRNDDTAARQIVSGARHVADVAGRKRMPAESTTMYCEMSKAEGRRPTRWRLQ